MIEKTFQTTNVITIKQAFKLVFKNSIFIVFSFINLFLPFYATIMSALNAPWGLYDVISVGLATSFITIFNQFLFLIAMITFIALNNNKNFKIDCDRDFNMMWSILLVYSLIAAALLIMTSFLYIHFSSIYKNVELAGELGFKYVGIIVPSLFFNSYTYLYLFKKRNLHKRNGYFILLSFFALNLILIPVLGILPNWNNEYRTLGLGLGFSVSSFIMFMILLLINLNNFIHSFRIDTKRLIYVLKKTKNFCIVFLLSTILKAFLIMILAIAISLNNKDTPPALMIAKIIWYNSLFFCGWFADGLLYSIQYARIDTNKYNVRPNYKIWTAFILLAGFITTIICIIMGYVCYQLPNLYVSHQTEPLVNPLPNWPYTSSINASSVEAQDYLWSPSTGVYNFNYVIGISNRLPVYGKSPAYALLYMSLYHIVVNSTKIMGIGEIEYNQKFNWKSLISNFILISGVMIFIVCFSVIGSDNNETIKRLFPGIDAFSFALLIIIAFLFLLTLLGYIKAGLISKVTNDFRYRQLMFKILATKHALNINSQSIKQNDHVIEEWINLLEKHNVMLIPTNNHHHIKKMHFNYLKYHTLELNEKYLNEAINDNIENPTILANINKSYEKIYHHYLKTIIKKTKKHKKHTKHHQEV